jgi:phage-related protein (TIGR01555 family)
MIAAIKGANYAEPLDVEKVKLGSLARFIVWDRYQVTPGPALDNDPESPRHGTPLFYRHNRTGLLVHNSRVARFIGRDVPASVSEQFLEHWGDSIIQRVRAAVLNFAGTEAAIAALALESNVDIIAIEGLREMLTTPDGEAKAKQYLEVAHLMKSILHTLVIDGGKGGEGGDKFHQKTISFAGLDKVWDRLAQTMCAAADIPMTRLFGTSPGGLNATGKGELDNYDDFIAAQQKTRLGPQLDWADAILIRSTLGVMPENYVRTFNPLRQMSAKEEAEIAKIKTDTLAVAVTNAFMTEHLAARQAKAWNLFSAQEQEDVDMVEDIMLEPDPVPPAAPPVNGVPPKKPPAEPPAAA